MARIANNNTVTEQKESIFRIEHLKEDTGFLMLQVSNLWKGSHSKALKKHWGLTHMQYIVLASIYWLKLHDTRPVTQTALAGHIRTDPANIAYLFRELGAKGYISRANHPANARTKIINLTQKGEELMRLAVSSVAEDDQKFFKTLGKNADFFNKYLNKLIETNY